MFSMLSVEPATFERVAWYERDVFQLGLIAFLVLAFLSVLAWPVAYLIRRLHRRQARDSRPARLARLLAAVLSILNLIFMVGLAATLTQGLRGALPYPPPWFVTLLVIPILTAVLWIVLLTLAALAWKDRYWTVEGGCTTHWLLRRHWFSSGWQTTGISWGSGSDRGLRTVLLS